MQAKWTEPYNHADKETHNFSVEIFESWEHRIQDLLVRLMSSRTALTADGMTPLKSPTKSLATFSEFFLEKKRTVKIAKKFIERKRQ